MRVSLAGASHGPRPARATQSQARALRARRGAPAGAGRSGRRSTSGTWASTAKYSVTPSLTLDATVNTDFAQVEVDEQQINLDRFNLFFPEKRPFFLENAGLFSVGTPGEVEVFFSRRIGIAEDGQEIPIYGGGAPVGTRRPGQRRAARTCRRETDQTVSRQTTSPWRACARTSRIVRISAPSSSVESARAIAPATTTRMPRSRWTADGASAATGLVTGYLARTATPGVSQNQHAYQIQARNDTQPLTLSLTYLETGENFNPEVGFLSRTGGFRKVEGAGVHAPAAGVVVEVPGDPAPHSTIGPTGTTRVPGNRLLAHRLVVGAQDGVGIQHGREPHARRGRRPVRDLSRHLRPAGNYDHTEAQLVLAEQRGSAGLGQTAGHAVGFSAAIGCD